MLSSNALNYSLTCDFIYALISGAACLQSVNDSFLLNPFVHPYFLLQVLKYDVI